MRQHGCGRHVAYMIGCQACGYREHAMPVTLGALDESGEPILALVLDEDGNVYEWITADTLPYAARAFIASGTLVVLDTDDALNAAPVAAARQESELYADCFGRTLPALPPTEPAALVVA
jgi:hypothetical protein